MFPDFDPIVDAHLTNDLIDHVAASPDHTGAVCRIQADDDASTYIVTVAYAESFTIERVVYDHYLETYTTERVIAHDAR